VLSDRLGSCCLFKYVRLLLSVRLGCLCVVGYDVDVT
jgi:hypothetical protein